MIYLLTHQREMKRKTNTGKLVADVLKKECKVISWHRTRPNKELLIHIRDESPALAYPHQESVSICGHATLGSFIILDGTWQEAQKMYNQSPYLHNLTKVNIDSTAPSIYTLRRNQKEYGLCTAECVMGILQSSGDTNHVSNIRAQLTAFIHIQQTSRSTPRETVARVTF